jgi:DNA-binding LytR/AlgR family response regulator
VIVDVHALSIRRALSWEALGIEPAPATIVTGFDPSTVSTFVSNALDFLVKPFDVERLESALDLATAAIGRARSVAVPKDPLSPAEGEKIVLLRSEDIMAPSKGDSFSD